MSRIVVAIDTSTMTQSVALLRGEALVAHRHERTQGHGGRLSEAIRDVLDEAALKPRDVDLWACGAGPGSFTGLRIGLASLKGFALALERPLVTVSSLQALALQALALGAGGLVVPVFDARKRELYAGAYRATPQGCEAVLSDRTLTPEPMGALLADLASQGEPLVLCGEGLQSYAAALTTSVERALGRPPALMPEVETPSALYVGRLALQVAEVPALTTLEPNYQRLSEAELKFGPPGKP